MAKTYFFYDLETSGLNARQDRIMQFAGQRTDMNLQPIGEPYNLLVALADDTLPSPDALMVTGITPQKTREEGYTEAEFAKILIGEIFTPDTIVVGYNSVRFDDEFIRHLLWRNFYDPYEWFYRDGRSRWDILDVVRMTRSLRPEGMQWPLDAHGEAINRLEPLTQANGISHENAHDAMSDVLALIDVTRLIRSKQPQLYEYLLKLRDKNEVKQLINLDNKRPFVYTSGRYDKRFAKTTVAFPLTAGRNGNVVVYDLRYDPAALVNLGHKELADKLYASWEERQAEGFVSLPTKELQYNRCPAVAPLGVLEQGEGWSKIGLDQATIEKHQRALLAAPHFAEMIRMIYEEKPEFKKLPDPESQLYDGFIDDRDRLRAEKVRTANEDQLADMQPGFTDERLAPLLLHYKARNYPRTLSESEVVAWETWRAEHLQAQLPQFMKDLQRVSHTADEKQQFVIQEMQLWAESILPVVD